MVTKSRLAIILSKLKVFKDAKIKLEQYPTDSEIAAEVLWNAYLQGDIEGKTIADLGCGTGILGIGALILGAKYVYFVDIDEDALDICNSNLDSIKDILQDVRGSIDNNNNNPKDIVRENIIDNVNSQYIVKKCKVSSFKENVDTVIQNPPFGAKVKNADREFLEKAFEIGKAIYSMHNATTKKFIQKFADERKSRITHYWEFQFPLKQSMKYHTKRITRITVGCWRIVKQYRN
ncbi:MAG: METTL5 family protein [Nanoarchaeota archaeon]|nr:METTL5 family protein [Nanoarchaeota archaeon]